MNYDGIIEKLNYLGNFYIIVLILNVILRNQTFFQTNLNDNNRLLNYSYILTQDLSDWLTE